MAQYAAMAEFTKQDKGQTSVTKMKEHLYVDCKNIQVVKGKIKAKYPKSKITFINIQWK